MWCWCEFCSLHCSPKGFLSKGRCRIKTFGGGLLTLPLVSDPPSTFLELMPGKRVQQKLFGCSWKITHAVKKDFGMMCMIDSVTMKSTHGQHMLKNHDQHEDSFCDVKHSAQMQCPNHHHKCRVKSTWFDMFSLTWQRWATPRWFLLQQEMMNSWRMEGLHDQLSKPKHPGLGELKVKMSWWTQWHECVQMIFFFLAKLNKFHKMLNSKWWNKAKRCTVAWMTYEVKIEKWCNC